MPCAFCGEDFQRPQRTRTAEHVFPTWLEGYLPNPGDDFTITLGKLSPEGAETSGPARSSRDLDIVARRVCEPCNTGWMNDIENTARPYLITVLRGNGRDLHRESQTALATWAVKTALALQLATPNAEKIPETHYRETAERQTAPPDNVIVWLGAYEGWRHLFAAPQHLMLTRPSTGRVSYADFTTLIVGHAIFQVLIHSEDDKVTIERGARANMATQIWPILGVVRHPPPLIVSDASLLNLATPFTS